MEDVTHIASTLDQLGFTFNLEKSEVSPTPGIDFLGFVLHSRDITVNVPEGKANTIKTLGFHLLQRATISIRDLAGFLGNVVTAGDSVRWALLKNINTI